MINFFFKTVLYVCLLGIVTVALWVVLIGAVPQVDDIKMVYGGIIRFLGAALQF